MLLVKQWMNKAAPATPLARSPAQWRALFAQCLQDLKLTQYEFRSIACAEGARRSGLANTSR